MVDIPCRTRGRDERRTGKILWCSTLAVVDDGSMGGEDGGMMELKGRGNFLRIKKTFRGFFFFSLLFHLSVAVCGKRLRMFSFFFSLSFPYVSLHRRDFFSRSFRETLFQR